MGRVAAFWTSVSNPAEKWESETEIGDERVCGDCEREWTVGDSPDEV